MGYIILLLLAGSVSLAVGMAVGNFWVSGILFGLVVWACVRSLTKGRPTEWHLVERDRPVDTTVMFHATQNHLHFHFHGVENDPHAQSRGWLTRE